MKKLFSILLVAMLLVTGLVAVAFATESATVTASSVTAKAGDEVTISFTLSGGEFANYGMTVKADSALTLTGIQQGPASLGAFAGNKNNGVVGFASTYNCAGGLIFNATFKISPNAKPGKYPVTVDMDFVADEKLNDLNVTVVQGYVTVVCDHTWGQWTTVEKSTCSKPGKAERTCSACGEVESKVLDTVAHSWGEWTTVDKPTCTKPGKAERTCSAGGEVETKVLDPVPHSWGEWTTV